MKKIWKMLRHHIREDFQLLPYLLVLIFLSVSISFNYYFDFEDDYVDKVPEVWRVPAKFLWFFFPYVAACILVFPFYKKLNVFRKTNFWIPVIFITICAAFDSGFPVYEWVIRNNTAPQLYYFLYSIVRNFSNIIFILIPAFIFYRIRNEKSGFYGLTTPFDPKPYFFMLLLMMPVLFAASLIEDFSTFYPMYKSSVAHSYLRIPEFWLISLYEAAYAWNFLSVEFIFRGFLVIGMVKVLGRQAILPMVVMYCFYHFGKPAGEAISSILGGYLLGIIAYESRSIFGGVLLHAGIALLMELFGFII